MNHFVLCFHVMTICGLTLFALRFGKEILIAWLAMLAIAMNLFVLKQITLFGLNVTASDALAVGYLLGLNLLQEFFGITWARKCMAISFFVSCSFLLLAQIHLLYLPNRFDLADRHFTFLFTPALRITLASLFSFLIVQLFDSAFFAFLKEKTGGKYLTLRACLALGLSQTLDTTLFSYLGLYGLVASVPDIIVLSLAIKGIIILLSAPFVSLTRRVVAHEV